MEDFRNLDRDIEGSAKRWKKFVESECPEKEKFPQEWKNKTSLQKLCMMRALRPDRMSYAVRLVTSRGKNRSLLTPNGISLWSSAKFWKSQAKDENRQGICCWP